MNCKFCQAELEEGVTLCPVCGKDNAVEEEILVEEVPVAEEQMDQEEASCETAAVDEESEQEFKPAKNKMTSGKLAVIYIAVIAVLAVLMALVFFGMKGNDVSDLKKPGSSVDGTVPADGNPDDVSCQGSYTVSNFSAKSKAKKVVATGANGAELTNAQLQCMYWMQVYNFTGNYDETAYGGDFSIPLDQQICSLSQDGWTWQQYFLNAALEEWHLFQALCADAEANAYVSETDTDTYLEETKTMLQESATNMGYGSADEMIRADMGAGTSVDSYLDFIALNEKGYDYYVYLSENTVPSEDQIRAYYEENKAMFDDKGIYDDGSVYVDVRHILLTPAEDDEGNISDDAWAACEKDAQALLDQWLAGDKTEDSFAELANEHSTDPGSNTKGGLYENVVEGQMVPTFNDWCFDESRQYGDYGIVKTEYGYHIMFYVSNTPVWHYYAESLAKDWVLNNNFIALKEQYPVEIDYSKIGLAFVDQTVAG